MAIAEYIARDNPAAAARWLDKIEGTLSLLASYPLMGEPVDHIRPGLRRLCQGSYLLFYEPLQDGIGLVRVLHAARDVADLSE